ncbi:hypothetical protein NL108_007569, partial [Boleophthalmus pectinirostris]
EYYINSVPCSVLPPEPDHQTHNILSLLPPPGVEEKNNPKVQLLRASLEEEVKQNYIFALKKSIVDYILMYPSERQRLSIGCIPQPFPQRLIRAPVPWAHSYRQAKDWQEQHLFTVSPVMLLLQDAWINNFSSLRFVRLEELFSASLPLLPSEFEELIQKQCQRTREELLKRWLPHCASLFQLCEKHWLPRVLSKKEQASSFSVELFNCAAALMSLQLRSLVVHSLQDLLCFFNIHKVQISKKSLEIRNMFTQVQVLVLKLQVQEDLMSFEPSLEQSWLHVHTAFMEIIRSAKDIPRVKHQLCTRLTSFNEFQESQMKRCVLPFSLQVECLLFPLLEELHLHTVHPEEQLLTDIINKAREVFDRNTVGPLKYLNEYEKYRTLLDGRAKQEVTEFLKEKHSLEGFSKKIESIRLIWTEIALMRVTVPLSMFCLHAHALNEDLCQRTEELRQLIVTYEVDENRDLNNKICQKYQDISDTIRSLPSNTEELVKLTQFIKNSSDVTVHRLMEEIEEAMIRLGFLLDHATSLSLEDVHLNARVFQWPKEIQTELELSTNRLTDMRRQAEEHLHTRFTRPTLSFEFKQTLQKIDTDIRVFKKKEIMNPEEMKANVANLTGINASLEAALVELEDINKEQTLLEKEQSEFPLLQVLIADKQPYEQLWTTALNFHNMSDVWMNGPFKHLDAEKISNELDVMWRTMHKLTKALSDRPGPYRVARLFKNKIEQFKQHLPFLTTICNPGLKDRHWEQISSIVGARIKPDEHSSLLHMLELGLSKFSTQLEELGASASKEYYLEKNIAKMKSEWAELRFTFNVYKDSGTHIVSAVDDIQVLLDDHIIKTQTMRGSPFIKPVEAECKEWEEKLLSMQDIVDSMLKCQAMWLYLEPIFSSEDIIAEMPEEGRKFSVVDGYWKSIIGEAVKDTRVLVATAQPHMLQKLQESNLLLDHIQKGLVTYLEEKRLFFPRFFFLSNDELLEILSQTKDPLCVQPHLKKCFEGIAKLHFTDELEITGMISSEKETVPL